MHKTKTLKPFEELARDEVVRLDWFGGVQANPRDGNNPLLECFFTPQDTFIDQTGSTIYAPKLGRQYRAGIAVGYLPGLFLGQYFHNIELLAQEKWPESETIVIDFDVPEADSIIETTLPKLDLMRGIVSSNFDPDASNSGLKRLQGTLVKSSKKGKVVGCSEEVVMPEIELIRYYLTNSTHSCKNIFTGAFTEAALPLRVVNRLHESDSPPPGKVRLVYRHGYEANDAPALARILYAPDDLGLMAARRVTNTINRDRINGAVGWIGHPRTYFPFVGKTRMTIEGKRFKTNSGTFIFLAHRIKSCTAPFPFTDLSFCDEIEPGGNPAPPGAPEAFPQAKPSYGPANDIEGLGTSKSNERPKSGSLIIHSELRQREYPSLGDIKIVREKLRDSTFTSSKKIPEYDEHLINASTGSGTSDNSSSSRQSLSDPIAKSRLSADLVTFIEILIALRKKHPAWEIQTLLVGDGFHNEDEWTSYFPMVPCDKRKSIMRIFSFLDEKKEHPRSFICGEVSIKGKYLYLFEAERRLSQKRSDQPYKEELPVLLVWDPGYSQVQASDFSDMINDTVIEKTWPSRITGFRRNCTVHGMGATTIADMSARIAQLILRNIEDASFV